MKYITFSKINKPYGWNSNFYVTKKPLNIDDELWLTTEHYFQAMKFKGVSKEYYDIIRISDSPMKAKALGSQNAPKFGAKWVVNKTKDKRLLVDVIKKYKHLKMRPDWDKIKLIVMIKAVVTKLELPEMKQKIKDFPDDSILVEHSLRDRYWGDGGDNGTGEKGKNYLGKILTVSYHILKHGSCDKMTHDMLQKVKIEKTN